jgi:hypothetical protein
MKSIEMYFQDWEGEALGYGYGTGEEHVLGALKTFFSGLDEGRSYNYRDVERVLTPPVAWLLINLLCHEDAIEYGTSPRDGWLTPKGRALRDFFCGHTVEQMEDILMMDCDDIPNCFRDYCNCADGDCRPANPFWQDSPAPPATGEPL